MVEARVLASGQATLVRLAPVGLLKQNQLVLREGDTVSVTGFEVRGMDGDLVVATDIRKGDKHVILRDLRGRPVWSNGWRSNPARPAPGMCIPGAQCETHTGPPTKLSASHSDTWWGL
jgi:hypothetical protein